MPLSEKLPQQKRKSFSSKCPLLALISYKNKTKNKNEHIEYHDTLIPFKSQIYNSGHNILRLFDALPNVSFFTSEMKRDYW